MKKKRSTDFQHLILKALMKSIHLLGFQVYQSVEALHRQKLSIAKRKGKERKVHLTGSERSLCVCWVELFSK